MINSPAFFARTIADTHRAKLGLKMPKQFDTAEADLARITAGGNLLGSNSGDLAHAVATALIAKRDPSTDPEVTRLVVAERISGEGISIAVREQVEHQLTEALIANADQMIQQWTTVFDKAAEALQTAAAVLGNVNLDQDATDILNRGGDVARHYIEARDANATLKHIAGVWAMLGSATRRINVNPEQRLLVLSPITLDDWETHQMKGAKYSPWELFHLGMTLKLPTFGEYTQRLTAHDAAYEQRATDYRNSMKYTH